RMARRNAIVRHLAAVETLGSASVIASDKTGTLTRNEMTVRLVVTASGRVTLGGSGYTPEGAVEREGGGTVDGPLAAELNRALVAGERASNATVVREGGRWTIHGDPTEGALIVAAGKAGIRVDDQDARLPRIGEVPFSSERKLMSTLHESADAPGGAILFAKGAPDVLLARCTQELVGDARRPLTEQRRAAILQTNDDLANHALRTLGVAFRDVERGEPSGGNGDDTIDDGVEQDLTFIGLVGMIDPPRPEAREAVALARGAGIRPLMITGDHPRTASVIARELGIATDDRVLTGAELDALPPDAGPATVAEVSVYARVNPEHKLRIV